MEDADPPSQPEAVAPARGSPPPDDKEDAPKRTTIRKRTKTGCLTCRKRRIKCDEGKPTCNNCIKSKRACEGYNQRVVFRDPVEYGVGHHGATYLYPGQPGPAVFSHPFQSRMVSGHGQGPLPAIAPKPRALEFQSLQSNHFSIAYQQPLPSGQHVSGFPPQMDAMGPGAGGAFSPQAQYCFNSPISQDPPDGQFPMPSPGMNPPAMHRDMHTMNLERQQQQAQQQQQRQQQQQQQYHQLQTPILPPQPASLLSMAPRSETGYGSDEMITDSEDDMVDGTVEGNGFDVLVGRNGSLGSLDAFGVQQRSFGGAENIVATQSSNRDSPLNDAESKASFWSFIAQTAPTISLYERNPSNSEPFCGEVGRITGGKRHIWTYILPMLSLNHPSLLYAILALGSLQVAKFHNFPETESLRHYHRALRRVNKLILCQARRVHIATLATTLLLGYFEVWSSDHEKWCKHLLGSRIIMRDLPFTKITRGCLAARQLKLQQLMAENNLNQLPPGFSALQEPDVPFLQLLSGRDGPLFYQLPDAEGQLTTPVYSEEDLEHYDRLIDLFWWYCKMDVYQSILSGTKTFMEFSAWTQTVPRSPMGCADAIYGTYDHLMLLLGRLASFSAFDIARKRLATKKQKPAGPGHGHPSPPSFPGMLPRGRVTTIPALSPGRESSPSSEGLEDVDLDAATDKALVEWEGILTAFQEFHRRLPEEFMPMEDVPGPSTSPFGTPKVYRTYSIAGIWMNFYMGLIFLHRTHPSMPPIAMVAAGLKAHETEEYALELGRIAAGLGEDPPLTGAISTVLAGAFIESCFCLFVAGIQYKTDFQRQWLIRRLYTICRCTGWQSARQIANGCESAWIKAHALGRGPPYARADGLFPDIPSSVWEVSPRRIDKMIEQKEEEENQETRRRQQENPFQIMEGISHEERRLVLHKSEQAHYALGLLGVEQDLEKLDLQDKT